MSNVTETGRGFNIEFGCVSSPRLLRSAGDCFRSSDRQRSERPRPLGDESGSRAMEWRSVKALYVIHGEDMAQMKLKL